MNGTIRIVPVVALLLLLSGCSRPPEKSSLPYAAMTLCAVVGQYAQDAASGLSDPDVRAALDDQLLKSSQNVDAARPAHNNLVESAAKAVTAASPSDVQSRLVPLQAWCSAYGWKPVSGGGGTPPAQG